MWFLRAFFGTDLSHIKIDRPIFLVGLPGSGASLLNDLLCAHEQAAYAERTENFPLKKMKRVRRKIREILRELGSDVSGARYRFVIKCPVLQTDVKALSQEFPDAYFVHVIREGRHAEIQAVRSELSNYIEIRFDEFLADPTGQILWLMNRVALPRPSPENLQFWEQLSGYLPAAPATVHPTAEAPVVAPAARQNAWDIDRGAPLAP